MNYLFMYLYRLKKLRVNRRNQEFLHSRSCRRLQCLWDGIGFTRYTDVECGAYALLVRMNVEVARKPVRCSEFYIEF